MSVTGLARPTQFSDDELVSITYVSSSTVLFTQEELGELLTAWRVRNGARGVTGVLLYRDGNIVQVLEGPARVVSEVFEGIAADPRHGGVIVVLHEAVGSRSFPDWSMGYRLVGDVERPEGHSDYLSATSDASPAASTRTVDSAVDRVLQVFRETCR